MWLVDMIEYKVGWLGLGVLGQWNDNNELLIWHSQQEDGPIYMGLDIK